MKRRLFAVLIGGAFMLSACEPKPKDVQETPTQTTQVAVTTQAGATTSADRDEDPSKEENPGEGATKATEAADSTETPKTTEEVKTTEASETTDVDNTTEAPETEGPQPTEPETTEATKPVETGEVRPVTVTVGKNVELDLSEDVGQVVRKVVDSDGCAYNKRNIHVFKADEDGNIFRAGGNSLEMLDEAEYCVDVDTLMNEKTKARKDCPGIVQYSFDLKRSKLKGISLLEGWDGDFDKLDRYMTNENSFLTYRHRLALFKNGKIVTTGELKEQYGDEAGVLIDRFGGDIRKYIMSQYNVDEEQVDRYTNRILCGSMDFYMLVERYEAMLKDEAMAPDAEDFLTTGACMQVAMLDWGSGDADVTYGSIYWDWNISDDPALSIVLPCSQYECTMIMSSRTEEEKGDIAKFRSMSGGWKYLYYTVPEGFDPDETREADHMIQVFEEEGLILGMTADKGVLNIVMGDPTLGYYDDKRFHFSERKGDEGDYTIDGDILTVIDPSGEFSFVFQRMTEEELERFNSMSTEEIRAVVRRARAHEDR